VAAVEYSFASCSHWAAGVAVGVVAAKAAGASRTAAVTAVMILLIFMVWDSWSGVQFIRQFRMAVI
jgi:hypothetical protein